MRTQLNKDQIDLGIEKLTIQLLKTLQKKGYGTFASSHEILGVLKEEFDEFADAIHSNNREELKKELMDIAVVCVFGYVCLKEDAIDW
jgi:NTP pyrophosphatase (non-canonical NTP hydrolase)